MLARYVRGIELGTKKKDSRKDNNSSRDNMTVAAPVSQPAGRLHRSSPGGLRDWEKQYPEVQ